MTCLINREWCDKPQSLARYNYMYIFLSRGPYMNPVAVNVSKHFCSESITVEWKWRRMENATIHRESKSRDSCSFEIEIRHISVLLLNVDGFLFIVSRNNNKISRVCVCVCYPLPLTFAVDLLALCPWSMYASRGRRKRKAVVFLFAPRQLRLSSSLRRDAPK